MLTLFVCKRRIRLAPIALIAGLFWSAQAAAFDPAQSGYSLVLSEDFTSIPAQWETSWWYQQNDACENAFIPGAQIPGPNGLDLHIESLESFPECAGDYDYSFAHLDAHGTAYVDAYWVASVQASTQPGTLTAWWLLPESGNWPPEVDITEVRGDDPSIDYMTNHYGKNDRTTQFTYDSPMPLGDAYHSYGVLIDGKNITWYLDGVQQGETQVRAGENGPLFPILSLYTGTCGDGWAGCPQGSGAPLTGWSADAYVQSVEVWTK